MRLVENKPFAWCKMEHNGRQSLLVVCICRLDACEDGWGNRLIAVLEPTVLQLSCTHVRANNIHLLQNYVG